MIHGYVPLYAYKKKFLELLVFFLDLVTRSLFPANPPVCADLNRVLHPTLQFGDWVLHLADRSKISGVALFGGTFL